MRKLGAAARRQLKRFGPDGELPFLPGLHSYDTHPFFKHYSLTRLVQALINGEVSNF